MTNTWINKVLAVVVSLGMVFFWFHQRPRLAEERAIFLGQEVVQPVASAPAVDPATRAPLEFEREADLAPAPTTVPGDPGSEVAPTQAATTSEAPPAPYPVDDYGVVAGHPIAVDVGMQVLEAGGNAVDAAIAVSYTLGVVEPFASGIGGGGTMVVHPWNGDPVAYDYRESAPLAGDIPASNIGVPGFVAGMQMLQDDYGTLSMRSLIEPAAREAEDGLLVGDYLRERLLAATYRMPTHLIPQFFPEGGVVEVGETVYQPDYARALRLIQDEGPDVFYRGELADEITEAVPGLSKKDLAAYRALRLRPSQGDYGGYDLVGAAAPVASSTTIQMLEIAEALGVNDVDMATTAAFHDIAQAWRVSNSQRIQYIGDPTAEDVDIDWFTSESHAKELAAGIPDDDFADVGEWEEEPLFTDSTDTTHFVIVDADGMMVSATNTLSNFFGSGLQVSGFWLNDQLKNFSRDPESINAAGPNKRPRSFTSPLILTQDGHPVLGIGSPGGRRIPAMVAQTIIRWAGHDRDLEGSVEAPRFHLEGRILQVEETPPGEIAPELRAIGYEVTTEVPTIEYYGAVEALMIDLDEGRVRGVADSRRVGEWDSRQRPDEPGNDT